jgi:hypothetical protein
MLRCITKAASAAAVLALMSGGAAFAAAHGAGTTTETIHEHETVVFSFPVVNPCSHEPGTVTAVATNSVFHITEQADGNSWVTGTDEGIATFTPEAAGGISASGHFTSWFGAANNNKNSVEHDTNTIHLLGTDGSRISLHLREHVSTNGKGEVKVEVETKTLHAACE